MKAVLFLSTIASAAKYLFSLNEGIPNSSLQSVEILIRKMKGKVINRYEIAPIILVELPLDNYTDEYFKKLFPNVTVEKDSTMKASTGEL
jgi:hypothetical protein